MRRSSKSALLCDPPSREVNTNGLDIQMTLTIVGQLGNIIRYFETVAKEKREGFSVEKGTRCC
jgi:hypothetical protein